MGDEEGDAGDDAEEVEDEVMDMMDEPQEEAVEYDLDEAEESEEDEVVEEATKLSDNVADPKGGDADNSESPFTKKPKETKVTGAGNPVKATDGGDGNKGESAKDSGSPDNLNVKPAKA